MGQTIKTYINITKYIVPKNLGNKDVIMLLIFQLAFLSPMIKELSRLW